MAIEPEKLTDADVGRRVKYLDGTQGTLKRFTDHYAFVVWDTRQRQNKQWVAVPGEHESATSFTELEFV